MEIIDFAVFATAIFFIFFIGILVIGGTVARCNQIIYVVGWAAFLILLLELLPWFLGGLNVIK